MAVTYQIKEDDMGDDIAEEAEASGASHSEIFRDRLKVISQWSNEVEDGDRQAALAYCVNEVYQTADNVYNDSSDFANSNDGGSGKFDLRKHTKMEDQ